MDRDDDSGDVLDDVAQIRPAVERLRHLVASATLLDLKATADGYWTDRPAEDDGPTPSEGGAGPSEGGAGPSEGGAGPSEGGAGPSEGGAG